MENASKALIIAAEVLLGVMIMAIGVVLFQTFAGYSEQRYEQIENTQIAEFNSQFLKFYGNNGNNGEPIECTIHDIISLAGLAQRNNLQYGLIEKTNGSGSQAYRVLHEGDNTLYVRIEVTGVNGNGSKLELQSNESLTELIKNNSLNGNDTQMYRCTTKMENIINNTTKRVKYMKFSPV